LRWLLSKADITKVVDPILHFLHEGRKDSSTCHSKLPTVFYILTLFFCSLLAQSGLIHLGTFILLFLSGEREFGVQLNKTFTRTLTIQLAPFTGNYADYLILVTLNNWFCFSALTPWHFPLKVFHKMLVDGHERLESLYECLLTILANISPYIKSLSMITRYFSQPINTISPQRADSHKLFLLHINKPQYQTHEPIPLALTA